MARVIARTADNRAARGRLRQTLGALADLRLVRVKKRYDRALRLFFAFLTDMSLELPNDGETLDEVLSMYIEHLWESGDPKYMAADCLAALRKMAPMTGGLYPTARGLYVTRDRHELPQRCPPISASLCMALVGVAIAADSNFALGACHLALFHGMWRVSEALGRVAKDFTRANDGYVVDLGFTKSGKRRGEREFSRILGATTVGWIETLLEALQPGDSPFPWTYGQFAAILKRHLSLLKLGHIGYKSHSFRRGGAVRIL
jgi:hypothetical protein